MAGATITSTLLAISMPLLSASLFPSEWLTSVDSVVSTLAFTPLASLPTSTPTVVDMPSASELSSLTSIVFSTVRARLAV